MGTAIDTNIPMIETTMSISISVKPRCPLPLRVGFAVQALLVAAAADLVDPRLGRVDTSQGVFHFDFPALIAAGHLIERNFTQIAFRHQILQRLRSFLLVVSVLVEHRSHGEEVVAKHALPRPQYRLLIDGHGDRHEYPDDRDHDEYLDQREAAAPVTTPSRQFHHGPYPCCWYR